MASLNRNKLNLQKMTLSKLFPGMSHISSAVDSTVEDIKDYSSGKKQLIKIFSNKFNDVIGGIRLGEQLTVAARPGVGKSSIANLLLLSIMARNPNMKFLFFYWTMEMSMQEQVLRLMSYYIKTRTATEILTGTRSDEDSKQVTVVGDMLRTYPVFMRDARTSISTCTDIWDRVPSSEYAGYNVVNIFDHTRLISGNAEREIERITNLMATGVEYKNKMGNTNIYLTQLNRNVETATGKDRESIGTTLPELSDIFGSDSVGQFSTMVMLLHCPSNYNVPTWKDKDGNNISTQDLLICKVGKNRNGRLGNLLWYEDLAHGMVYDSREELTQHKTIF